MCQVAVLREVHTTVIRLHKVTSAICLVYLINSFSLHPGVECPVALFIGLCHFCLQDSR